MCFGPSGDTPVIKKQPQLSPDVLVVFKDQSKDNGLVYGIVRSTCANFLGLSIESG